MENISKKIVITVSYGDYTKGIGGTDKVILAHQRLLNEKGISVLHLFRQYSISSYFHIKKNDVWQVLLDGKNKGLQSTRNIVKWIENRFEDGFEFKGIYIHHFMNVDLDELAVLISATNIPVRFYIHDYMSICVGGGLVKPEGIYCGEEKPNDSKCKECQYHCRTNVYREKAIRNFFYDIKDRLVVISPSSTARDIWLHSFPDFADNVRVIYHQKMVGEYTGNTKMIQEGEKLRIAFVGYPKPLKGWGVWKDAVDRAYQKNEDIEFYQFGTIKDHIDYINGVEIDFKNDMNAMIKALRKHEIHCVVLWSLCPETYSYTYYESFAANAFILTNKHSGNIAIQTEKNQNGIVADSVDGLANILEDEDGLRECINQFRKNGIKGPKSLTENPELLSTLADGCYTSSSFNIERSTTNFQLLIYNIAYKLYSYFRRGIRRK